MDSPYDNPFDSLSYDEKILSDKLGMSYSDPTFRPEPAMSVNNRVMLKMRENDMIRDEIRREIQRERAREPPIRETFVGGNSQARTDVAAKDHGYPHGSEIIEGMSSCGKPDCSCGHNLKRDEEPVIENKTLIFLIFILAAFCVIQWLNVQSMNYQMNDMMNNICKIASGKYTDNVSTVSEPVIVTPPVPVETGTTTAAE
jgi:hypothetical protein